MSDDWQIIRLGDLGRIVTGKTPPTGNSANFGGSTPFVTPSDMDSRKTISSTERFLTSAGVSVVKSALIPAGSVMVSCIGSDMGKAAIAGCDCVTNQQINSIVVDERFDHRFVYYNLSSRKAEIQRVASGAAQPILNKRSFSDLKISLPTFDKQQEISDILSSLDDKIDLNRRMDATLKAMGRALFKSWFVEFNPVKRNTQGAALRPEDPLFPAGFQDSLLGKIPLGWNVTTLGEVLDVLETGRRPKGGVAGYSSGIPSIGAESIWGIGKFDYSKTKYVPEEFYERTSAGRVEHNDVLLYKDGGKPGEFRPRVGLFGHGFPFEKFCINEHVFRMRSGSVGQIFLYFTVSDQRVLDDFANKGGKAAIPGINQVDVRSTRILMPDKRVLEEFNRQVTPWCDLIIQNAIQSRTLANLRDALLPKLLNGQLKM